MSKTTDEVIRQINQPPNLSGLKVRIDEYAFAMDLLEKPAYNLVAMAEEAGECLSKLKKHWRDGLMIERDEISVAPDISPLALELGVVLFYWVYSCYSICYTPDEIFQILLNKISSRKARNTQPGSGDNR